MKLGIVGLGMIGGSIARTLKANEPNWHIKAYSQPGADAFLAYEAGVIDAVCETLAQVSTDADLVLIAVPPSRTVATMEAVLEVSPNAILIDVASSKGGIIKAARASQHWPRLKAQWCPAHPIAGREGSGFSSTVAGENIFADKYWIRTPFSDSEPVGSKPQIQSDALVSALGSKIVDMRADQHDKLMAFTSHFPHLNVWTLLSAAQRNTDIAANLTVGIGGGLRDQLRIGKADPKLWTDIFLSNAASLDTAIADCIDELSRVRGLLASQNRKDLEEYLSLATASARALALETASANESDDK